MGQAKIEKKRFFLWVAGVLTLLFIVNLFILTPVRAENGKDYEKYLRQPGVHTSIINFLRKESKVQRPSALALPAYIILFAIDLSLSLLCLWVAVSILSDIKKLFIKNYLWFLFVINLGFFVLLFLFKAAWKVLDFLVIRLRPDLGPVVKDNFCLILIISAVLLYIWLLARMFNLNFFGASGVFFFSHLIYLALIYVFFLAVTVTDKSFLDFTRRSIGARPIIQDYLSDAKKIASGQGIISLFRIKPFHF